MTRLLRAELLRLFATPSRVVVALVGLVLALGSAVLVSVVARDPQVGVGLLTYAAPALTWFVSVTVAVLAVFLFGGDWGNRSIIHSFVHSNRGAVLAAKFLVLVGLVVLGVLVVLVQLAILVLPPAGAAAVPGAALDFGSAAGAVLPVAAVKTLLLAFFGAALATALTSMWGGLILLLVGTFVIDLGAKIGDVIVAVTQQTQLGDSISRYTPNNAFGAVASAQTSPDVLLAALAWIAVPWAIGVWRWMSREV